MRVDKGVVLRVDAIAFWASVTLAVRGLVVAQGGRVVPLALDLPLVALATRVSQLFPLPVGELVSVSVVPIAPVWRRGAATAAVSLWYGALGSGREIAFLTKGFPDLGGGCWWTPEGHNEWNPRSVGVYVWSFPAPAAGAEWSVAGGTVRCEELLGYSAKLVTDANAANRYAGFQLVGPAGHSLRMVNTVAIAAGLTRYLNFLPGYRVDWGSPSVLQSNLGSPAWSTSSAFGSYTISMQVGDQYSDIALWGRFWAPLWPEA